MESELSADKKVEQLSEEELHCVLKQLTTHNIPSKSKCGLVQRLNQEDANSNTSYSSLLSPSSGQTSNRLRSRLQVSSAATELEKRRSLTQANHAPQAHSQSDGGPKAVNYAQSLQELTTNNNCDDSQDLPAISNRNTEIVSTSSCHTRSGGSNRKPNRANSFTMPSPSDNNSNKNESTLKILDHHHHLSNGSEVSREALRVSDKQSVSGSWPVGNHKCSSSSLTYAPQSCSNSSHYLSSDTADRNHSALKSTCSPHCSSIHTYNLEQFVNTFSQEPLNHNHPRSNTERATHAKQKQLTVQEEDEEKPLFGEVKVMHQGFDIIQADEFNKLKDKDRQSNDSEKHSVDKTLDMPMLMDPRNESSCNNFQTVSLNQMAQYGNNFAGNGNATNGNRTKKKKRAPDVVRKSEHVEGYVGYIEDVDYLESFVNNKFLSNNGSTNVDKKNKGKIQKNENEKRTKRNNGEIKLLSEEGEKNGEKGVLTSKAALSNSSSFSGDETSVVKNGIAKSSTSLEMPNFNETKLKKGKSKSKQENKSTDKMNGGREKLSSALAKHSNGLSRDEPNENSSSNASDTENEEPAEYYPRSNSLLPTNTVLLQEDDNLHTVSDSEMTDREKGFVTPKTKYFKKKKIQQSRYQQSESCNIANQKQSSSKHLPYSTVGVHNLGRGYESEREYSLNNSLNPNSFACQSLSSSMLAINARPADRRALSSLSPPTKEENADLLPNSTDLLVDKELMFQLATSDTHDNGPKMPSYADIAKSFNQPSNVCKSNSNCPKPLHLDNCSSPLEEFPQLNSRSPDECTATVEFLNYSTKVDSPDSLSFKQATPSESESTNIDDHSKKENISTQNQTLVIQEESDMNPEFENLKNEVENLSSIQNNQEGQNLEFLSTNSDIPVVIYGNQDIAIPDMKISFNCDQLVDNSNKLSFGFFDESEISMIRETDFSPLDQVFFISNSKMISDSQPQHFENIEINGNTDLNSIDDAQLSEEVDPHNKLQDIFYKNAVHVNVLEDQYFLKIDDQVDLVQEKSEINKTAYSSSTSSPLSFDFSPSSSVAVSALHSSSTTKQSEKCEKPFVSCVSTLSNLKFVDNVDLCSFNYTSVIHYVYKSWEQYSAQCNTV